MNNHYSYDVKKKGQTHRSAPTIACALPAQCAQIKTDNVR
jgi:hypothetical protein